MLDWISIFYSQNLRMLRWLGAVYLGGAVAAFTIAIWSFNSSLLEERPKRISIELHEMIMDMSSRTAWLEAHMESITSAIPIDSEKVDLLISAAERIENLTQNQESFLPLHEIVKELKCVHFDTKNFSNSRSSSNLGHNRETNRCGSALTRSMKALQASKRWRMEA